jgi:hypothetical protein
MRNTWRKKKMAPATIKKYKLTDLLWWTEQEKIMQQIAKIMKLDSVDTSTPGWFPLRTAAAKMILEGMTEAEITKLRTKGQEFAEKGFPVEMQRK